MKNQKIESTKIVKFLDECILFAKGSGKTEKLKMLERIRAIAFEYYERQPGFVSSGVNQIVDLFDGTIIETAITATASPDATLTCDFVSEVQPIGGDLFS